MIADAGLAARLVTSWLSVPAADRKRRRRTGGESRRRTNPGSRRGLWTRRSSPVKVDFSSKIGFPNWFIFLEKPTISTQDANVNERIKEDEGKVFCQFFV